MTDLENLLQRLVDQRVEFVIVGGYAAVLHGSTVVTRDVDICCRFTPANLRRLQQAVADLHPVHRLTPRRRPLQLTARSCRGLKNLYLKTDLGVLDCLGEVLGVGDYSAVRKQSIELKMELGPLRVLNLEAMIQAKVAMGRPRDLQTLVQLKAIRTRTK